MIRKSTIRGKVSAPPSKNYAIRLVFSSLFTDIALDNLMMSDDVEDALNAVSIFGVRFDGRRFIRPEKIALHSDRIYLKGSATVLRMLIPIAAVVGGRIYIDGGESLRRRPIKAVVEALSGRGVVFSNNSLPTVMEGRLRDTYIEISGHESSQYISGFMIAFAMVGGGTIKIIPPLASRRYVELTAEVLTVLGVDVKIYENRIDVNVAERPRGYTGSVPGDYLLASFYVSSALLTGGEIVVDNLANLSGDAKPHRVVDAYREMGGYSLYSNGVWHARASDNYAGIRINVFDDPDLAVSIASLAAVARGETVIEGIENLRIKESDRVETIISTLRALGIYAYTKGNSIHIVGGEPREASISCPDDHRIAMMFASIALRVGGSIDKAECVNKSNPGFWRDLILLGGDIHVS